MRSVCDLSQWQHGSFERTNQTESSRGPCGLFIIIQETDAANSSVVVSIWGWREEDGGREGGRDAGMGGVREEGWMDGKLMYVGRKKYRLPSHHQSDLNMHNFMFNQFIKKTKTQTLIHTHLGPS